jgi:hypothetical protein
MPVYRYKLIGVHNDSLSREVPGSVVLGSIGPYTYVDITAEAGAKSDLDQAMALRGFEFSEQDPSTTPQQQAAATNDFIFGSWYQEAVILDESSTTSETYQLKVSLNTSASMPAGKYIVLWSFYWRRDPSVDFKFKVTVDGTSREASFDRSDDDVEGLASGFLLVELTAGSKLVKLEYCKAGNRAVYISDSMICIWRTS